MPRVTDPDAEWFGPPMQVAPESGHIIWTIAESFFEARMRGHMEDDGTFACDPHVMLDHARESLIDAAAHMAKGSPGKEAP